MCPESLWRKQMISTVPASEVTTPRGGGRREAFLAKDQVMPVWLRSAGTSSESASVYEEDGDVRWRYAGDARGLPDRDGLPAGELLAGLA